MRHILYCQSCRKYTLKRVCSCFLSTTTVRPPKYSPLDKYAEYRRKAKLGAKSA